MILSLSKGACLRAGVLLMPKNLKKIFRKIKKKVLDIIGIHIYNKIKTAQKEREV